MKAFILCGNGTTVSVIARDYWKWTDTPRVLLPLNGEDVLGRQLRQLRQNGVTDITLTLSYKKNQILAKYGLPYIECRGDKPSFIGPLDAVHHTKPYWKGEVLILVGDLVCEDACMRYIVETPGELNFYVGEEGYAMKFDDAGADKINQRWNPKKMGGEYGSSLNWTLQALFTRLLGFYDGVWLEGVGREISLAQFDLVDVDDRGTYLRAKQVVSRDLANQKTHKNKKPN